MRKTILTTIMLLSASAVSADEYVHGYTKPNGTYVQPYYRSSPNGTTMDNYSTRGNINPYTGQQGTISPYQTPSYGTPYRAPAPYQSPYGQPQQPNYGQPNENQL